MVKHYKQELKIHKKEQMFFERNIRSKKRENYVFDKENFEMKIIQKKSNMMKSRIGLGHGGSKEDSFDIKSKIHSIDIFRTRSKNQQSKKGFKRQNTVEPGMNYSAISSSELKPKNSDRGRGSRYKTNQYLQP
jgi:hypothetical protein